MKPIDFLRFAGIAFLYVWLIACEKNETTVVQAPPTAPVTIQLAGSCRVDNDVIVCDDSSRSLPANQLASIAFHLYTAAGAFRETRTVSAANPSPRTVSFSGLANGSYEVLHKVQSNDGGEAERTYRPLIIN